MERRGNNHRALKIVDGEIGECPFCGYSLHLDSWLDVEMDQVDFYLEEEAIANGKGYTN